jgi:hypothetical protein
MSNPENNSRLAVFNTRQLRETIMAEAQRTHEEGVARRELEEELSGLYNDASTLAQKGERKIVVTEDDLQAGLRPDIHRRYTLEFIGDRVPVPEVPESYFQINLIGAKQEEIWGGKLKRSYGGIAVVNKIFDFQIAGEERELIRPAFAFSDINSHQSIEPLEIRKHNPKSKSLSVPERQEARDILSIVSEHYAAREI